MKLLFVRLRNVKSFGEGPDGQGVVVRFQPGINRVAGRNGHGKSTIIEAVGLALFSCDPIYEENFQAQTYFLRAGEKTGEIEVGFEHRGEGYRVVRPLGVRNPVRDKVVCDADGSLAAEGKAEVDAFLCRLFRVPGPGRLQELFGKLLGVKQGRLAWPFDSKAAEARRHFEPLLDVDVFRQCFDRLKPAADRLEDLRQEVRVRLEGAEVRLRDRAGSVVEVERWSGDLVRREAELAAERVKEAEARAACAAWETKEGAARGAERAWTEARQAADLAEQRCRAARQSAEEARRATTILESNATAFAAFEAAEKALIVLQARWAERQRLERASHEASTARTSALGQRDKAASQRDLAVSEIRLREQALAEQADDEARLKRTLEEGAEAHERGRLDLESARAAEARVRRWRDDLDRFVARAARETPRWMADLKQAAAWSAERMDEARAAVAAARARAEESARELAAKRQERETLARQLSEIGGGLCPFLKESCRQFDPSRVQRDVSTLDERLKEAVTEQARHAEELSRLSRELESLSREEARLGPLRESISSRVRELRREHGDWLPAEAETALAVLERVLGSEGDVAPQEFVRPDWPASNPEPGPVAGSDSHLDRATSEPVAWDLEAWDRTRRDWRDRVDRRAAAMGDRLLQASERHRREEGDRARDSERLRQLGLRRAEIGRELASWTSRRDEEQRRVETAERAIVECDRRIAELRTALEPHASLAGEIEREQGVKSLHVDGHRAYLGAREVAKAREAREAAAAAAESEAEKERARAAVSEAEWAKARAEFDPEALAAARRRVTEAAAMVRGGETALEAVRSQLERERARLREWEEARREAGDLKGEMARLEAARKLAEGARRLLRDAAPRVAQRICDRLSVRAQRIFHRIHPDPVELAWSAENYGLRIEPGERRFAMLSGGEQTKLALALTLSMIREFSDLRFCIFDEPTYGVDADSRGRLADAIVEVQEAADFEQIVVVSHDDAFEGRIEHVVLLQKTAGSGSFVASGQGG